MLKNTRVMGVGVGRARKPGSTASTQDTGKLLEDASLYIIMLLGSSFVFRADVSPDGRRNSYSYRRIVQDF